jgi:citrate lyase subunit beta/citryl-CoA lyase
MIAKSRGLGADQVILDLEDSVAGSMKDVARNAVVAELKRGGWDGRIVSVRVNPPSTDVGRLDLEALATVRGDLASIVIPKVDTPEDVVATLHRLGDRAESIGIEVLIESAAGLANVGAIAASSEAVEALVFGPLDMAASLGIPSFALRGDDPWLYVRSAILVAARVVGANAIDGPSLAIDDPGATRAAAEVAAAAGYDGKWVIHPSQIDPVNEAFSPTREAFDEARRIVEALQIAGRRRGQGASAIDGIMVDKASRRMAERILARGRAAGLR